MNLNFASWSPRASALVAGVALACMAALGGFGNFGAIAPLITPDDALKTAKDITEAPILFFAGIISLFVVTLLDIIVAGAFYAMFKSARPRLSATAAVLRVLFAVIFMVTISRLVIGFSLLSEPESALPVLESFNTIWVISLGLFGIHLCLVGHLAYRSGTIPRLFGILLAIAGIGYLADAIGMLVVPGFSATFAQFFFIGEIAIIFWLLIGGRRLSTEAPRSPQPTALAAGATTAVRSHPSSRSWR